ncbi:MAG TPA: TetR family transcriptional regulator [Solirubrobacterales bacterium]|nr:TetR family transcriptional regulator [Solirubrobacterales bacterium]
MARRYEQTLRAEAAAETRRRILDAVYQRLRAAPAEAVRVEQIAKMAGVARSTVYVIFGSRAGLFDALGEDLYERSGYAHLLEAVRVEDAWESASGGIRAGVHIFAADRDVFRALHSMEELDPDAVGGAIRRIEEQRAEGMMWAAGRLRDQGYLRHDVGVAEAAHIMWIQASFEAFDLLYTGRGLSANRVAELLVAIAERSLIDASRIPQSR